MGSIGDWRGNNTVECGQGSGNMGVSGQGSSNMVVSGQGSSNMVVVGHGNGKMVVSGGEGRSVGGSKRSNNIGVIDQGWVSLSLTLDNMFNRTILGNIRWAMHTIGHSSVVLRVVVAGNGVASNNRGGNSSDNGRNNALEKGRGNSPDNRGSNSPYKWGGNSLNNWGSNSPNNWGSNSP